jgi:hypothetical protein
VDLGRRRSRRGGDRRSDDVRARARGRSLHALVLSALVAACGGGEVAVALHLTDPGVSCTPEQLADVDSVEVLLSHEGILERACVSVAAVSSIETLEAALSASGLSFGDLGGGDGRIEVRGFDDPGCSDVELCGSADYSLPRDSEISIPIACGGCQ